LAIPQITADQVALLESMANGLGAFSQAVPDAKQDSAKDYEFAMNIYRDNEQLVILGLIKDITETDACKDKLVTLFSMTGRMFRVYEITPVGRLMFSQASERTVQ
jgi:hypothetical protein